MLGYGHGCPSFSVAVGSFRDLGFPLLFSFLGFGRFPFLMFLGVQNAKYHETCKRTVRDCEKSILALSIGGHFSQSKTLVCIVAPYFGLRCSTYLMSCFMPPTPPSLPIRAG